jgi:hypothetical protein
MVKIDWIATRFYMHLPWEGERRREGKGKSKRRGVYYMPF